MPENATTKEVRKALESYLKQSQGKTVITSDGKTVRFSGKSTSHLVNNSVYDKRLMVQSVAKIIEVFKTGEFIARQDLYKERKDKFVAFHIYRKWVDVETESVLLQVKAAELDSGKLVAGDGLLAYSAKELEKGTSQTATLDSVPTANNTLSPSRTHSDHSNEMNNKIQVDNSAQDEPYIFLEILEVRDR
ncbi:hypothetical protein LNQ82_03065 [Conchiformibius steedae DSM 2580]|uniref:Large polyvalent protein-associated domain-containing protein n=1 Tax=Conchiformibius steedae DSM 2580 TaxID=1121352 RepID=A0AAE9HTZ4_9NEIS|nr:hypothetical protein [Conchiformibius steedae]QMT33502.1 hypothetical protein H3L98_10590 [Conchiformibius steedae]URD68159.1 hypothetical protein LNQ82_03065 [Conchiformibius steedae DSM 2580]